MIRVLVIEDDSETAAEILEDFTAAGFSVDHEATGPDGLRRARSEAFDVITLDRMLPDMDGLAVLDHSARLRHPHPGAGPQRPLERRRTG